MRRATTFLLGFALASRALVAHADDKAATAQALFEEARTLMASGDYATACKKFEGSQSLDPGPGTEYNLALCYEKSGRTASAWAMYLNVASTYQATNRPEWEKRARDRATALESTLSRLTIIVPPDAPAGARIARDGAIVIPSALGAAIPVDPGVHVVTASAEGAGEWQGRIDVAPGAQSVIQVPASWPHAGRPEPKPVQETAPPAGSGSGGRTAALVIGGIGIVAAGVGTVSGLVAMNDNEKSKRDCPNDGICLSQSARDANASAKDWATVSTIGFIAAGALLATSVVVWLASSKSTTSARAPFGLLARGTGATIAW
jgi:hypothetical protein